MKKCQNWASTIMLIHMLVSIFVKISIGEVTKMIHCVPDQKSWFSVPQIGTTEAILLQILQGLVRHDLHPSIEFHSNLSNFQQDIGANVETITKISP